MLASVLNLAAIGDRARVSLALNFCSELRTASWRSPDVKFSNSLRQGTVLAIAICVKCYLKM